MASAASRARHLLGRIWRRAGREAAEAGAFVRALATPRPAVISVSPSQARFLPDAAISPVRPQWRSASDTTTSETRPRPPSIDAPAELSVVLGSFNRRTLLERAIESVRADTAGLRAEIIVVDGGSTDGSIEWLVTQRDIVTVVQHNRYERDGQTRRRMSWGRFMNIGFRAASAGHVLMISDDCYLLPGSIPSALERIGQAEAAGLRVGACAFYFRNWPLEMQYYVQRTLGGNLMVNHGIYTREALKAAGYANEDDYAFYKADSDLSLSIWREGYVIIDAPGAICEHFMSEAEAARVGNTQTLEFDRTQLQRLWPTLALRAGSSKMGKIALDWQDPAGHAARVFGDQVEPAAPAAPLQAVKS